LEGKPPRFQGFRIPVLWARASPHIQMPRSNLLFSSRRSFKVKNNKKCSEKNKKSDEASSQQTHLA
jgi:hypothetical protein